MQGGGKDAQAKMYRQGCTGKDVQARIRRQRCTGKDAQAIRQQHPTAPKA